MKILRYLRRALSALRAGVGGIRQFKNLASMEKHFHSRSLTAYRNGLRQAHFDGDGLARFEAMRNRKMEDVSYQNASGKLVDLKIERHNAADVKYFRLPCFGKLKRPDYSPVFLIGEVSASYEAIWLLHHHFKSLPARSSKRNGPLVLGFTGGNL